MFQFQLIEIRLLVFFIRSYCSAKEVVSCELDLSNVITMRRLERITQHPHSVGGAKLQRIPS